MLSAAAQSLLGPRWKVLHLHHALLCHVLLFSKLKGLTLGCVVLSAASQSLRGTASRSKHLHQTLLRCVMLFSNFKASFWVAA